MSDRQTPFDSTRILSAESLLSGAKKLYVLDIPEFDDGQLLLRQPSAGSMVRFTKAQRIAAELQDPGEQQIAAQRGMVELICNAIVNPDGKKMFAPEDVDLLADLIPMTVLNRVSAAVMNLLLGRAIDFVEPVKMEAAGEPDPKVAGSTETPGSDSPIV